MKKIFRYFSLFCALAQAVPMVAMDSATPSMHTAESGTDIPVDASSSAPPRAKKFRKTKKSGPSIKRATDWAKENKGKAACLGSLAALALIYLGYKGITWLMGEEEPAQNTDATTRTVPGKPAASNEHAMRQAAMRQAAMMQARTQFLNVIGNAYQLARKGCVPAASLMPLKKASDAFARHLGRDGQKILASHTMAFHDAACGASKDQKRRCSPVQWLNQKYSGLTNFVQSNCKIGSSPAQQTRQRGGTGQHADRPPVSPSSSGQQPAVQEEGGIVSGLVKQVKEPRTLILGSAVLYALLGYAFEWQPFGDTWPPILRNLFGGDAESSDNGVRMIDRGGPTVTDMSD